MKFGSSRSHLYDAQKTARARWDAIPADWADATRGDFETGVWLPLDRKVTEVLRAIDQLTVLFAQVRQECEFE